MIYDGVSNLENSVPIKGTMVTQTFLINKASWDHGSKLNELITLYFLLEVKVVSKIKTKTIF